ncbi:MAG: hypothetical protein MK171_04235 [Pirellulales bacterium]|nr:hypothetical protein [Pirellulales bacterium]
MPTVLRELMRHSDITTTMKYYVGANAEATADELWAAVEGDLGTTLGTIAQDEQQGESEKPCFQSTGGGT